FNPQLVKLNGNFIENNDLLVAYPYCLGGNIDSTDTGKSDCAKTQQAQEVFLCQSQPTTVPKT
ncbi:MAG: hypothetical protein K2X81_18950, partial [Candidatus Obscuribacterales bacterium]|nr:hypothetical protein [Candidatus Obscuribacterales bacterium]